MVELDGVEKTYDRGGGRVTVLAGVTARVAAGELVVLEGPPGAGKSTLLRLLWGAERPTAGSVRVLGTEVSTLGRRALARLRRRLGVVPEVPPLIPDRSILDNVAVVLRGRGLARGAARLDALEALRTVGLGDRAGDGPGGLGPGERWRLGLARVLAIRPPLLLVDGAPLAESGTWLAAILRVEHTRGATVLLATREPAGAALPGSTGWRLEAGRLTLAASAGGR